MKNGQDEMTDLMTIDKSVVYVMLRFEIWTFGYFTEDNF